MELTIQSVNFDASDQLKAFTEKKIKKLERFSDEIIQAEVILKVVKPDSVKNKDAAVKLNIKQKDAFANKFPIPPSISTQESARVAPVAQETV